MQRPFMGICDGIMFVGRWCSMVGYQEEKQEKKDILSIVSVRLCDNDTLLYGGFQRNKNHIASWI